ncbi:MAG TPA: class I SAM-dependent methyltransferase [Trebonia sp.]|nr:class I SAM-dependent methyltransferase [Trebonia sp.]
MPTAKDKMALSFGGSATSYDRLRPRYPADAVTRAIGAARIATAVDLGAGTGLLTAALAARGLEVIAVEPDVEMTKLLTGRLPDIRVEIATAEHLPLGDATVDAVFAGQAFHWFTRPDTDREIARVLRPDGIVAILTNVNPVDADWEGTLHRAVLGTGQPSLTSAAGALDPGLFTDEVQFFVPNPHRLAIDAFLALPRTWSWVATATPAQQKRVAAEAERLARQIADPGGTTVTLPYSTRVVRAVRRG